LKIFQEIPNAKRQYLESAQFSKAVATGRFFSSVLLLVKFRIDAGLDSKPILCSSLLEIIWYQALLNQYLDWKLLDTPIGGGNDNLMLRKTSSVVSGDALFLFRNQGVLLKLAIESSAFFPKMGIRTASICRC